MTIATGSPMATTLGFHGRMPRPTNGMGSQQAEPLAVGMTTAVCIEVT